MSERALIHAVTGESVARIPLDGSESDRMETALDGSGAVCIAVDPRDPRRVYVGTFDDGVYATDDGGRTWRASESGLGDSRVLSIAVSPSHERSGTSVIYAGTEPSRLFVLRDGGAWSELEALQDIPSRDQWSFPPRPWTHHVRWIAPDPHRAERLLVGIELGGLMYTDDGGASFTDHRPGAKRDAHNIAWHPTAEGRAYQAAGDGAAWSRDGGQIWEGVDSGRDLRYCWALAVDPEDPECWYVSAASGPGAAHSGQDARGGLYRWEGGGWRRLELPGDSMPYALAVTDGDVISGMADGRLLRSGDQGASWEETGVRVGSITAIAAAS